MQKIVALILIVLLAGTVTELHQVLRLPQLLEHFQDHRSNDSSLSLVGFLKIHYGNSHPDDRDDNEDNELPFRSVGHMHQTDPILSLRTNELEVPFTFSVAIYMFPLADGRPCHRSNAIFHPPCAA